MQGHCLCGAVSVDVPDHTRVSACHCGMCRRWGGGPLLAVHVGGELGLQGGEQVKTFSSSDWAERGFCAQCGTHLYYRLKPSNEYILSAGLFPDQPFALEEQIFIDRKPPYYDLANQTPKFTEQQVLEMFASGKAGGAA